MVTTGQLLKIKISEKDLKRIFREIKELKEFKGTLYFEGKKK